MTVRALYFSPTGTTARLTLALARRLAERLGAQLIDTPYTLPPQREQWRPIASGELLVWGSPVYAGRVPNKTLEFLTKNLHGEGNRAVVLATFGNRSFGDAVAEMCGLLENGGMHPIAATAMVTQHAFAPKVGEGRPSEEDLDQLRQFIDSLSLEAIANPPKESLEVTGDRHTQNYYVPLKEDGTPAQFLKARPIVCQERCDQCGLCIKSCPMGSIAMEGDYPLHQGICIKCQACIQCCPHQAISLTHPDFLSHRAMLQQHFTIQQKNWFWKTRP